MKKVLVMCTGNSCRSIIGEALINSYLDGVKAKSCGVNPSGRVNPNAKRVLEKNNCWDDSYHSKHLDSVINEDFDLVVTVCDHAKESCPMFPKPIKKIHVSFTDPDGKEYEEFEKTFKKIKEVLLPKIKKEFTMSIEKKVSKVDNGVKINFLGAVEKNTVLSMVQNCSTGKCECMSDDTKAKIKDMKVDGEDGDVKLSLEGNVSVDEIKEALSRSKVIK